MQLFGLLLLIYSPLPFIILLVDVVIVVHLDDWHLAVVVAVVLISHYLHSSSTSCQWWPVSKFLII